MNADHVVTELVRARELCPERSIAHDAFSLAIDTIEHLAVPAEPTVDMLAAGGDALAQMTGTNPCSAARFMWVKMVEAARNSRDRPGNDALDHETWGKPNSNAET